jgi:DNA-binding NarL/FixJ family response regulator
MTRTKVLLVDDHPLVREWLSNLINQQADMIVCGEAEDAPHALSLVASLKPHLAIVDLSLKSGSGIQLIKDLRQLDAALLILVLSMHDESLYAERVLRAGARGYVMKREVTKKIIGAIRDVLRGEIVLSEKLATTMLGRFLQGQPGSPTSPVAILADRELEVFQLLGRGWETRRIAEELRVSIKTVQAHCARIKEKLNLKSATELLREAIRWEESHLPR